MRVIVSSNNLIQVNTYFVIKDDKCLIIDPGSNVKQISRIIEEEALNVVGVVLTHTHFDHFLGCNEINKMYDLPLYVHPKGVEMLYDSEKNESAGILRARQLRLDTDILVTTINEETKNIASFNVNIFHIPGHSPDGIAIYFKEDKIVFSGDSLFKLSIGRSDFYKGDEKQLITNVKNKLFSLPDDTVVYPGHGPSTTIGYEKKNNPYLR